MGLTIGFSRCSCAGPCKCYSTPDQPPAQTSSMAMPNPRRFEVLRATEVGLFVIVLVRYPDATNYEGRKILIYRASEAEVRAAKALDPHFCDNPGHLSPRARFEPTDRGWLDALTLARALTPDGMRDL